MYAKILASVSLLFVPFVTMAGQPVHEVRGHALYSLDPPELIEQITINAAADENGVVKGSVAVFPSVYLTPPNQLSTVFAGWTWVIKISSLSVTGNVAVVDGMIVFDNRFPDLVGCTVGFIVTDNGSGPSDPPDELELHGDCAFGDKPILGGNFTVN